jgi:predicted enzyme related to lactoylglutathione lyase
MLTSMELPKPGSIVWSDLTVPNAAAVRDFYARVTGWSVETVSVGEYSDYVMVSSTGDGVAGICHARGENANVPAQWLMYIVVEDVGRSAAECIALGGTIIDGPRPMSGGTFCVIRDPAGAVCALFSAPAAAIGPVDAEA